MQLVIEQNIPARVYLKNGKIINGLIESSTVNNGKLRFISDQAKNKIEELLEEAILSIDTFLK